MFRRAFNVITNSAIIETSHEWNNILYTTCDN